MPRQKTLIGSGCLFLIFIIGGFILLLKSCLSKYDERSAKLPAIIVTTEPGSREPWEEDDQDKEVIVIDGMEVQGTDTEISEAEIRSLEEGNKQVSPDFKNNQKSLIFSIVAFDKTTSYSSGRGMTHKTVNTTYSIQTNDLHTAKKIKYRKLKDHLDITEWPIKILGYTPHSRSVWIFMGELIALNGITLETIADTEILAKLNPWLNGKFPKEARYYEFEKESNLIFFTATDGQNWELNPVSLKASVRSKNPANDKFKKSMDSVENLLAINARSKDSVYENYSVIPGKAYRDKQISLDTYHLMQNKMMVLRTNLDKESGMLRAVLSKLREQKNTFDQTRSVISTLGRTNPGYRSMSTNLDTLNNQWIGIYNENELHELTPHIYLRRANDETARRFLVKGQINYDKNNRPEPDLISPEIFRNVQFLDGGLLLNKATGLPFRLNDNHYLIAHRDVIGKDGKVKISLMNDSGQLSWTAETGLKSWYDWQLHKDKLVIFGQDNKELMGDDANVLLIVDMDTGKTSRYDYFTDRD